MRYELPFSAYACNVSAGSNTDSQLKANSWEPDWQWAFWGPNYPRILSIKQKYDPENLLWCHHCVGSESFVQQNNGSLCRVF
jgi:hypothetical protein